MPKKHRRISGVISILFFLFTAIVLLFEGNLCKVAVVQGISLCLQSVIPCLFPFLVLTRWVIGTDIPDRISFRLARLIRSVFHCSENGTICIILGLIGGYPIGAQTVALTYKEGRITRNEAEYLLSFCNNASPAFFFGILGSIFGSIQTSMILYAIHIMSAILTGLFLRPKTKPASHQKTEAHQNTKSTGGIIPASIKSLVIICGYVLLFQIIVRIADHYLELPKVAAVIVTGILEITSGSLSMAQLLDTPRICYCLASGFFSFGGICVYLQARTFMQEAGLEGKLYLLGKTLQAMIAMIMTSLIVMLFPTLLQTVKETLYLPNHKGLLSTMLWMVGIYLLLFVIWCLILRKKTGKKNIYDV